MKIINIDKASKSSIYPKVDIAVQQSLQLANPAASHFAGNEARAWLTAKKKIIASAWGVAPELVYFAINCGAITEKLSRSIRWGCFDIEHRVSRAHAEVLWSAAAKDGKLEPGPQTPYAWSLYSVYNNETGLGVFKPELAGKNVILDVTGVDPDPRLAKSAGLLFFSSGKHGALPGGVLLGGLADPAALIDASSDDFRPNMTVVGSLAAAYEWLGSDHGRARAATLPDIKASLKNSIDAMDGWFYLPSDSPRILAVVSPYQSDLVIGEAEDFGLALAGGSACSSGGYEKNRTVAALYGSGLAGRTIRLSWDHIISIPDANEVANRLRMIDLSIKKKLFGSSITL